MDIFNCDDVATLLTEKAEVCRQLCLNGQYSVWTGSRDIWLASSTITVIFFSVIFYFLRCCCCHYCLIIWFVLWLSPWRIKMCVQVLGDFFSPNRRTSDGRKPESKVGGKELQAENHARCRRYRACKLFNIPLYATLCFNYFRWHCCMLVYGSVFELLMC